MLEWTHGFRVDSEKCNGCLACMRACPTHAIRVKGGKARLISELCIDCGLCLRVCKSGTITATTRPFADFEKFRFKVAVPSPVLFGQFPLSVTPAQIVEGLLALGFDEVWDYELEIALSSLAIHRYIEDWQGPYPLISISCPSIVRLVQVAYPRMVEQLIHVQPPRELAGREIKRQYAREMGLDESEIGAIYITPCQAKTISILQPAEGVKSDLDGTVGISDLYNGIMSTVRQRGAEPRRPGKRILRNAGFLRWSTSEGLSLRLSRHRYIAVTGVPNVVQVFDDIEMGKLRNIEFLECYTCFGGCSGGNLTVDNVYVTLGKLHSLMVDLPERDQETEAEVRRRFPLEDFPIKAPLRPRPRSQDAVDIKERVRMVKRAEEVHRGLPGLDCGLCGAPTCRTFAEDVGHGEAREEECIFHARPA
jgi:Fe-S-cluster-containing hydrogenase component 2